MLAAPFSAGVGFYAFYAMQPYLLELYGDPTAYGVAGIAAAVIAAAQIAGGILVPQIRKLFSHRTHAMILGAVISVFFDSPTQRVISSSLMKSPKTSLKP